MYSLIRPLLFSLDPETAHDWTSLVSKVAGMAPIRSIVRAWYAYDDERLRVHAFGILFKNPIGLAAGFDKNAEMIPLLGALGFGFLEIGTVTPYPQVGNPKPRMFRLPEDRALINRMGFNGKGVEEVRKTLTRMRNRTCVVGINIGKNKITPNEKADEDYLLCFQALSGSADYIAVNVSSPNTPGLRELQGKDALVQLLTLVQVENKKLKSPKPILLKIAPDLTDGQLDDIVAVSTKVGIHGIIATNTSVERAGLVTPHERLQRIGDGGLSGRPLRDRSTQIIRSLYKKSEGKIPIIGVGGIFRAEDAYDKICAGATLVQMYTGLIYEGPGLVKKIKKGLAQLLEDDGFRTVQEAIGSKNK